MLTKVFKILRICVLILAPTLMFAKGASLNFKNANIRDVIEAVSKATGKNFLIDPRVNGQVTLLSSTEMKPEALYSVFLSILKIHGFIAIDVANEIIKIIPNSELRTSATIKNLKGQGVSDEVVMGIIPIEHTQATALIPILRPLISRNGHLVAHDESNNILVSDTRTNIYKLKEIISKIDNSNKSKLHILPLINAQATSLVPILKSMFIAGNKNISNSISITAEQRTNSLLIQSSSSKFVEVQNIVEKLDISNTSSGGIKVIKVNNSKASDIEAVLNKLLAQGPNTKGEVSKISLIQGDFRIAIDTKANTVVAMGLPNALREIERLIQQLDIKRKQVMVQAIIVEVSAEKSAQFGLQWGKSLLLNSASIAHQIREATKGTTTNTTANSVTTTSTSYGLSANDAFKFTVLTDLLGANSNAKTNLLSAPSILTIENEEAVIEVGQEVPFITSNKSGASGGVFQTISRKSVGIKLSITPQINNNNVVKLKINQEISGILPSAQAQSNATDIVTSKRLIKTNVLVKNNSILVLGGLIDDHVLENERPTTLISDIPILGYPFRATVSSKSKRNLMIFIKPTVIIDETSADNISLERYNYMRNLQKERAKNEVLLLSDEAQPVLEEIK